MNKSKFYKCDLFSYYYGNGLFWFRIFNLGLSFKNIYKYSFSKNENKNPKGMFINKWLITFIK